MTYNVLVGRKPYSINLPIFSVFFAHAAKWTFKST